MDTLLSDDNGARGTSHIFHIDYFDYRGGFQAVLIRTPVYWVEYS